MSATGTKRKRILTGDRPTGKLHLGHYVGSLLNRVKLQHEYETFLLVADIQALTTHWERPELLRQAVLDVTMDNLAVGIDPEVTTLCVQSMIPEIAELTVLYGLFTNMNKLRHNPTTKAEAIQYGYIREPSFEEALKRDVLNVDAMLPDTGSSSPDYEPDTRVETVDMSDPQRKADYIREIVAKHTDLTAGFDQLTYGFFGYPLSQAADITFVRANLVPVGEDQKPHIELTRDVVGKFNQLYGNGKEIIPLPEALIGEVPRLHALDGSAKMSKSLGNAIALSDPPETVKEMVWKAVTDPAKIRKNDPGHPEICNVFAYHSIFQGTLNKTPGIVAEIERDCRSGALGCVECKGRLTDYLNKLLAPVRDRRRPYEENPDRVREILREGTKKAQQEGRETLALVKAAMKIDYFKLD